MPAPLHLRVFLASPGDVADERALALKVLDELQYDPLLRGKIMLEVVAWDKPGSDTPMLATMTPQEAISRGLPKPGECDIVVVIFWSRMGTPLPEDWRKPDGSPYLSGTEWEYRDAVTAFEQHGTPAVLVYRRTEEPLWSPRDPEFKEKNRQWQLVEAFFDAFRNPDDSIRSGVNHYDTPTEFQEKLAGHLRKLIADRLASTDDADQKFTEPLSSSTVEPPLWEGSPFPGLRPFSAADAPIFFGRGRETDDLIERLAQGNRFLAVVGASGSGKSSLVAAGLLPRLASNAIPGSRDWQSVRCTPGEYGDNPFMALAAGFKTRLEPQGRKPRDVAAELLEDAKALDDLIALALEGQPEWAEVLLFLDQFEELFTVVDARYREPFIALLDHAAQSQRLRIVLTLRADFYPRCVEQPALAALLRDGSYPLAAPGVGALHEMITGPAARAGLQFKTNLAERILDDTGSEPGALPLMAFALAELYKARSDDGQLSHAVYDGFGGVQGAIAQRAEAMFEALDKDAAAMLDRVFRHLVEVDETEDGWVATRRRAPFDEVADSEAAARLVDAFTEARLLVRSRGEDDRAMVEVAHEALLRNWPRLVRWIQDNGEVLRIRRECRETARKWKKQKKEADAAAYLYRGARLSRAEEWAQLHKDMVEDEVQAFLDASIALRNTEQQRQVVRRRRVIQGLSAFLVFALLFSIFASIQWNRAERQTQLANEERNRAERNEVQARENESRALAALSGLASNEHRYIDAVKLAIAAWPRTPEGDRPELRATVNAMAKAQRLQRQIIPPLRHEGWVRGAAFSADGTRILSRSDDDTVRLWDAASGAALGEPLRHQGAVRGAAFNADETRILSRSSDGTVRLWDISRLPRGHLIDVACGMIPDHDTSELRERYGIEITEPICGPETPAPVWTRLKD